MRRVILPLFVVTAQAAVRAVSDEATELHFRSSRISPELEPESDKKFFKKDYPWDKRPVADKYYVFDHPYPAVQDSSDYDRDYVKDENSDGGRWQAQMEYDTLRSKIGEANRVLKELKEKMEKEYEDWMKAKGKYDQGKEDAEEAEKLAGKAKTDAEDAQRRVNELEGRSPQRGIGAGGAVGDAIQKVEDEMDDLEKCKKELEEAKKKLKKLLKDKEEYEERKAAAEKAAKEQAEKDAKEEAERKKREAEEAERRRQQGIEDELGEDAWRKKLEREKKQYAEASSNYEKHLKEVKQTEDQLARAAENLRKFRRPPYVDDDGGVYNVPKSGTSSLHAASLIMFLVMLVLILL